jgi:hypothetical protein
MLLAPRVMTGIYGLPRRPRTLAPWLGARDLLIGVGMLHPRARSVASAGRGLSDLLDFSLIASHALASSGRLHDVRGRLLIAVGSSLTSFYAASDRAVATSRAA